MLLANRTSVLITKLIKDPLIYGMIVSAAVKQIVMTSIAIVKRIIAIVNKTIINISPHFQDSS